MIRYLRIRLDGDTTPDAMDSSREADILQKNPRIFLKNVFEAMVPRRCHELLVKRPIPKFLLASLNIYTILHEATVNHGRQGPHTMIKNGSSSS